MDLPWRIGHCPQTVPSELTVPVDVREVSEEWLGDVAVGLGLPPLLTVKISGSLERPSKVFGDGYGDRTTL